MGDRPGNSRPRAAFDAPEYERARRLMAEHVARDLAVKTSIFRRSLAAALGLFLVKLVAGLATNSLAVIASSLDSLLDAALSALNWFSAVKAEDPPDDEHAFGHGKVESLVGGLQALVLGIGAVFIGAQGVGRLIEPQPIRATGWGIAAMLVSGAVALLLSRSIRRRAEGSESPTLAAEQLHYSMDFTTHAGVVLALVLQNLTHIDYFDPFVSMLIAVFILWQVRGIIFESGQDLLDRQLPTAEQDAIVRVLQEHSREVLAYHGLRTRRAGSYRIVSLHVVLCKAISFEASHHVVDHIEEELMAALPRADVTIHADPCGEYCPGEGNCPWAQLLGR